VVRERQLAVTRVEVESGEDDPDRRIEGLPRGDGRVVGWGKGLKKGAVGATDVGDGFGVEFGLDAGFAEDEDRALIWREG
jgi:hypothetical protein